MPLELAWWSFTQAAVPLGRVAPALWALAACGLVALALDPVARKRAGFVLALVAASALAIVPGFFFRPHYFVLTLPAAALLAGIAVSTLARRMPASLPRPLRAGVPALLLACALGSALASEGRYLFASTPDEVARTTYGLNPFPESIEIARFLRERTTAEDRIAVFGSEPQIYFYAGRRAATGYIYMYPLMETHDLAGRMQDEMILEVAGAKPRFLVYVRVGTSWLARSGSHGRVIDWYADTSTRQYRRVGLIELSDTGTEYDWGPQVHWPPRSQIWIEVMERVDARPRGS
jgi:hypothetical protein